MREADALTLPVFFKHPVGLTVGEIATLTGAKLRTGARLDDLITNVAPLNRAGSSDLAFLDTAKYADVLTSTRAGACLMTERFESQAPSGMNVLRAKEPYRAFVIVARRLFEDSLRPSSLFEVPGCAINSGHPSIGPDRASRNHRSRRGDRAARFDRSRNRDRRQRGGRRGRADRPRLLDWPGRIDHSCHRRQ
jgi:hypothetical protein